MAQTEKFILPLPALYADHHVVEVRRLLFNLPGVQDVYASSSFGVVEVQYDSTLVTPEQMTACLEAAGYLGELPVSVETSTAEVDGKSSARHTAVYEQTRSALSFTQNVSYRGRPMWPCPGMGPIRNMEE